MNFAKFFLFVSLCLLSSSSMAAERDPFPTPSETGFTNKVITVACRTNCAGDLGLNSTFGVTASVNSPSIPVGTGYTSLRDIYSHPGTGTKFQGPTIVRLTAGDHIDVEFSGTVNVDGPPVYFVCASNGPNQPATFIHPSAISTVNAFNLNGSATTALMVKNCYIGPTSAALMANPRAYRGYRDVVMTKGGTIILINDTIRNAGYSCTYAQEGNEWFNRQNAVMQIFDTTEIGCGGGPTDHHNNYEHALKEFWMVRSVSSDTTGAHEVKTDVNKFVFWHSWCLRDTGIGVKTSDVSACMNINSYAQDTRIAGSVVGYNNSMGTNTSLISVVPRGNFGGGASTKVPPMEDIENDPGAVRNQDGMFAHWASNGFKPGVSNVNSSGKVVTAVAPGGTSIVVGRMAHEGNSSGISPALGLSTRYTVRVRLSNGNVQQFTSVPTASTTLNVTFPVTVGTCNGSPAPATICAPGVAVNAVVSIKPDAVAWDYRALNPRFYNRADSRYFFGKSTINGIRASDGTLDVANRLPLIPTFFAEDNLFYIDSPANSMKMISQDTSYPEEYTGTRESDRGMMPAPPICRTGGPTTGWPNVSGCGTLAEPQAGASLPDFGRSPSGFTNPQSPGSVADWVWFNPVFLADNGLFVVSGGFNTQIQIDPPPAGQYNGGGDVRYLDSSGVIHLLNTASSSMAKSPFTTGQTTITNAEPVPPGTQNLPVANGTNCSNGQKIMVRFPVAAGTDPLFISTIDMAPSMGSIHVADPTPARLFSGAMVACITKAGARPPWWVSPSDYPTK